ncbi:MAG: thiamine pyrophosphate-dependent enzyme [Patescibacteria group bacterium]|nr:thiamine pyrophosphate-dependent enzyme [Patescibacteria group bacterium]
MNDQDIKLAFPKCARLASKPHKFCPGCGHPEVLKALGFAIDELGLQKKTAFGVDIGCSLLAWNYFNLDSIETHHGRTIPTMVGFKKANPDAICVAYVGDGGAYAIGAGHFLNAAIRNENITVIVVNNAVYAMTGGQEAPTTLPGMKVATAPCGADQYYMHAPELVRNVNPTAFVARGITTIQVGLRKMIKEAIQHQLDGKGFSFVEVLSQCPLNWKTMDKPQATFDFLEKEMAKTYPVKYY